VADAVCADAPVAAMHIAMNRPHRMRFTEVSL
jgi:hypothetical protein